jgi:uncharacterized protein YfaQ (DUF2300 family)
VTKLVTKMLAHLELSRDYFEREARFCNRVIFLWVPSKRWAPPCDVCHGRGQSSWCVVCTDRPYIEGVEFASESAAAVFDLERLAENENGDWEQFDSWEQAETWLRGARGSQ